MQTKFVWKHCGFSFCWKVKSCLKPKSYWINTSGNSINRQFIHMAKSQIRREIECLIAGETVEKEIEQEQIGIVIEVKYLDSDFLEKEGKEALEQIRKNQYEQRILDEGMKNIYAYGIVCFKKHCQVVCEKL